MPEYRQHNVHAEVVQPEPAKPRPESTDDLREQIATAIAEARKASVAPGTGRYGMTFAAGSATALGFADAALEVVGPLLATKDAELQRWMEQNARIADERDDYHRQLDEAHTTHARLMQEHNTVCALAVSLRNDIVRLVTAALGSWDDKANADEQIAAAVARVAELTRERDEARALVAIILPEFFEAGHPGEPCLRSGWVPSSTVEAWRMRARSWRPAAQKAAPANVIEMAAGLIRQVFGSVDWPDDDTDEQAAAALAAAGLLRKVAPGALTAQEAGESPDDVLPCGHSLDRVENDEVTADEHERLCCGVPSGGDGRG